MTFSAYASFFLFVFSFRNKDLNIHWFVVTPCTIFSTFFDIILSLESEGGLSYVQYKYNYLGGRFKNHTFLIFTKLVLLVLLYKSLSNLNLFCACCDISHLICESY